MVISYPSVFSYINIVSCFCDVYIVLPPCHRVPWLRPLALPVENLLVAGRLAVCPPDQSVMCEKCEPPVICPHCSDGV